MAKQPSFSERLSAFCEKNRTVGGTRCHTCSLDADVKAAIRAEKAKGSSMALIARALRAEGHRISPGALQNHFRTCEQRAQ